MVYGFLCKLSNKFSHKCGKLNTNFRNEIIKADEIFFYSDFVRRKKKNNHKIERLIMSSCITKAVCFLFICMIMCVMMCTTLYMDMRLFFPSHIIFLLLFGIRFYFVDFFYISSWYKCNKTSVCHMWNLFNQLLKCCVYPSAKLRHRKRGLDFLIWVSDHVTIISMQIRITHADHDKVAEYGAQSYRWHGFQSIFYPKPVRDDTYIAQCI